LRKGVEQNLTLAFLVKKVNQILGKLELVRGKNEDMFLSLSQKTFAGKL